MKTQLQLTPQDLEQGKITTKIHLSGIEIEAIISFEIDEEQKPVKVLKTLNKYLEWLASDDCKNQINNDIAAVLDVAEFDEQSVHIGKHLLLIVDEEGDPGISFFISCNVPGSERKLEIQAVLGGKKGKEVYDWDTEIV